MKTVSSLCICTGCPGSSLSSTGIRVFIHAMSMIELYLVKIVLGSIIMSNDVGTVV